MSAAEYNITVRDGKFYCDEKPFTTFTDALSYRRGKERDWASIEEAAEKLILHNHATDQREAMEIISIVLACIR